MNLSCSVIRDLLPLYAENLASAESGELVREHLETCLECRKTLEELKKPEEPVPERAAPVLSLKKELRKRRLRTASMAALGVFLILFAVLSRVTDKTPLFYSPALLRVVGLEEYDPESEPRPSGGVSRFGPDGWQTKHPGQALVLERNARVSGVDSEFFLDEETGELTVYIQYFSNRLSPISEDGGIPAETPGPGALVDVFYPVPDRVIYGFGQGQELLWGKPMNGGVEFLPRLALAYYFLLAAALAVVLGVAWAVFRKKSIGPAFAQLWFAPASYLLGHLLIKGTRTVSEFFLRDLCLILVETAALYLLLTLCLRAWRQRRQDRER